MLLYAALLLVSLVLSGAALNVVSASLGIGLLPEFPGSDWAFLIKNFIADAVLWIIVLGMGVFALSCLRERRRRRRLPGFALPPGRPLNEVRVVAALTAYNDALSIGDAVRDFKERDGVEKVIVVDNNSSDGTSAYAVAAGARVTRESRQGYGYACMRGLREALNTGADVIVLCEGDCTFSGRDIGRMVLFLEEADMVVGNRITPGLVDRRSQMDTFFVWGNQLGAKLLQLRFWDWRFMGRMRISDLGCTYRAIRREALAEIIDELHVGGNHFSPHMIMVSLRKGHTVVEVPVRFLPRVGQSKGARNIVSALSIGMAMFWHILTFPLKVEPVVPSGTPAAESVPGG